MLFLSRNPSWGAVAKNLIFLTLFQASSRLFADLLVLRLHAEAAVQLIC